MQHRIKASVLMLLAAMLLYSCAGRQVNADLSRTGPRKVLAKVADQYRKVKTLDGKGILVVEMPEFNFRGNAEVRIQQPDSLYFLIEAGLGVDVGYFFASRERFSHYSPFENTHFYGPTASMNRLILFQMEIGFDELMNAAVGAYPLPFGPSTEATVDDNRYIFTRPWQGHLVTITVHPERYTVESVVIRNDAGEVIARQRYRRFRKVSGIWIPHFIQLFRLDTRERLTINYSSMSVNKALSADAFSFRVPDGAKQIRLK